jgi:hypothetical protein
MSEFESGAAVSSDAGTAASSTPTSSVRGLLDAAFSKSTGGDASGESRKSTSTNVEVDRRVGADGTGPHGAVDKRAKPAAPKPTLRDTLQQSEKTVTAAHEAAEKAAAHDAWSEGRVDAPAIAELVTVGGAYASSRGVSLKGLIGASLHAERTFHEGADHEVDQQVDMLWQNYPRFVRAIERKLARVRQAPATANKSQRAESVAETMTAVIRGGR